MNAAAVVPTFITAVFCCRLGVSQNTGFAMNVTKSHMFPMSPMLLRRFLQLQSVPTGATPTISHTYSWFRLAQVDIVQTRSLDFSTPELPMSKLIVSSKIIANFLCDVNRKGFDSQLFWFSFSVLVQQMLRITSEIFPPFFDANTLNYDNTCKSKHCRLNHNITGDDVECLCPSADPVEGFDENLSYLPGLGKPVRRKRTYACDSGNQSEESCSGQCTKNPYKPSSKRCLLIYSCTCCNRVLGFSLLDRNETPRIGFEIMFTRFKVAPRLVVYDNSCNLQHYCMLREPHFFKNTLFVIDRFHRRGHVCSPAYDPRHHLCLNNVNTSRAEQVNSALSSLSNQLKYMCPSRYFFFLRDFLSELNVANFRRDRSHLRVANLKCTI